MEAIFKGVLVGLSMVVLLGPVFFTLLQTTLQKGTSAGIAVAIGIFLSDIVAVILSVFGVDFVSDDFFKNQIFLLLSFIILLVIGLKFLLSSTNVKTVNTNFNNSNLFNFLSIGFLVNLINPFVFVVWFSVVAYTKRLSLSMSETVIFFISNLLVILISDLLKVSFARKIKSFLSSAHLKLIYKIIGFIMLIFSFRILYLVFS